MSDSRRHRRADLAQRAADADGAHHHASRAGPPGPRSARRPAVARRRDRFGIEEPVSEVGVQELIDRAARERANGLSVTYVITLTATRRIAGLLQVRQLDPAFEAAEWECTLAPSSRGTGIFLEAARLAGSFAFGTLGAHRLEARVLLQNGRANGALRKLGAVQEGVLRRSVRRAGEYFDQVLWSMLKEDWGDHWVSTAPRVH